MKVEQVLAAIAEVSFDDIDLNKDGVITPEEWFKGFSTTSRDREDEKTENKPRKYQFIIVYRD
jgi:hypothetical protein